MIREINTVTADYDTWIGFELAICCERHPMLFKIICLVLHNHNLPETA